MGPGEIIVGPYTRQAELTGVHLGPSVLTQQAGCTSRLVSLFNHGNSPELPPTYIGLPGSAMLMQRVRNPHLLALALGPVPVQ